MFYGQKDNSDHIMVMKGDKIHISSVSIVSNKYVYFILSNNQNKNPIITIPENETNPGGACPSVRSKREN